MPRLCVLHNQPIKAQQNAYRVTLHTTEDMSISNGKVIAWYCLECYESLTACKRPHLDDWRIPAVSELTVQELLSLSLLVDGEMKARRKAIKEESARIRLAAQNMRRKDHWPSISNGEVASMVPATVADMT